MSDIRNTEDPFLQELIEIINQNVSDDAFGVSELADQVGMSRSNLLRKIQKAANQSASVFIRNIRLHHGRDLLRNQDLNVSEVAYQVGFGSPSYFVKCYREEFGYPPGEEKDRQLAANSTKTKSKIKVDNRLWAVASAVLAILVLAILFLLPNQNDNINKDKSIAVLPFQNDSSDSSNVYFINGMMEAILNNLQKIEDLRVISRTSTEKYRNSGMSLPEIAKELNVSYLIEGSGQKLGDQILLTVQLIKAEDDGHMWSEQYRRQNSGIFNLQASVSKDIAQQVKVRIAPEELERIEKVLTTNLLAYDYFLKGIEGLNQNSLQGLERSVVQFEKALEEDDSFAEAYAYLAIAYFYFDFYKGQRDHGDIIEENARKALKLDPESSLTLTSRGLNLMYQAKYDSAIQYFEKVIEINPNSARAYNTLSDIYVNYLPNNRKYLEYALKGIRIDMAGQDSSLLTYSYLHLSNALVQNGFLNLAEEFIKKSIALDDNNLFSKYVYAYILFAEDKDYKAAERRMLDALAMDTLRLDIVQEIAKLNYASGDYERAAIFYDKMYEMKELLSVDLFESEDIKASFTYEKVGRMEDARKFLERYRALAKTETSDYKYLMTASLNAFEGNIEEGMKNLAIFSEIKGVPFWFILFVEDDPILLKMSDHPDFDKTIQRMKDVFWEEHEEVKKQLTQAEVLIL